MNDEVKPCKVSQASKELLDEYDRRYGKVKCSVADVRKGLQEKRRPKNTKVGRLAKIRYVLERKWHWKW